MTTREQIIEAERRIIDKYDISIILLSETQVSNPDDKAEMYTRKEAWGKENTMDIAVKAVEEKGMSVELSAKLAIIRTMRHHLHSAIHNISILTNMEHSYYSIYVRGYEVLGELIGSISTFSDQPHTIKLIDENTLGAEDWFEGLISDEDKKLKYDDEYSNYFDGEITPFYQALVENNDSTCIDFLSFIDIEHGTNFTPSGFSRK